MDAQRVFDVVYDYIRDLDPLERTKLAALILNETDPSATNMKAFFNTLEDDLHTELIYRATEEEERE